MENIPNNTENKKPVLATIIAGIAILVALIWWLKQAPTSQQVQTSPTPDAEVTAISQEVDSINVGDLNTELDEIDKDLQGL